MASLARGNLRSPTISRIEQPLDRSSELGSTALLDVVQVCFHTNSSEWIFLRELRVGTGFHGNAAQRLDAFALNCFAHTSMKRVCYEVKTSRTDFLCEMKQPLKRRIGQRYSNEFYFVTPAGLLNTSEVPIECGLVEIGTFSGAGQKSMLAGSEGFVHFDPDHRLTAELRCQRRGEKRQAPPGNLLRVCYGTSKNCSAIGLPNRRTNNGCRLSTEPAISAPPVLHLCA